MYVCSLKCEYVFLKVLPLVFFRLKVNGPQFTELGVHYLEVS